MPMLNLNVKNGEVQIHTHLLNQMQEDWGLALLWLLKGKVVQSVYARWYTASWQA